MREQKEERKGEWKNKKKECKENEGRIGWKEEKRKETLI